VRDLTIIGAGPAGLTAAIYAARKKIDTVVYAKDIGGQVTTTVNIENYIGFTKISGLELIDKFKQHADSLGIEIKLKSVERVEKTGQVFSVFFEGGIEKSRTIIIASGKSSRRLNVPGEKEFFGRGVSDCATCDAPLFTNLNVAVVGGGNSALTAASQLVTIAKKVSIIAIEGLTGDPILQDRVKSANNLSIYDSHEVVAIEGNKLVERVKIRSRKTGQIIELPVRGVFVEIGLIPNSKLAANLVRLNDKGEIMVDCACRTGIPGLFAAGDVTDVPEKQIIVAAGEGAKAALSAYHYLIHQNV
jgi:alkyl hydroperoxide reductase subunit F